MCKLFTILDIENEKKAERFALNAIPFITATDNHGLGIMRLGENGVYIQRWLQVPTVIRKNPSAKLSRYQKALASQSNEAGRKSSRLDAIAIHGRFATCEKTLENTHPFFAGGSALIHNGIISNSDQFKKALSTCDSEVLLWQYIDNDVRGDIKNLGKALSGLSGYYAGVVFNNNGTVDIWRDDTAKLFISHVRGIGTVIATTEEIIIKTAKRLKVKISAIDEILSYTSIRWRKDSEPVINSFEVVKPYSPALPYGDKYQKEFEEWDKVKQESNWWEQEQKEEQSKLDKLITGKSIEGKFHR